MNKNIVFMGTNKFSAIILDGLIKAGFKVVLVVTKADDVLTPDVIPLARRFGIDIFRPQSIKKQYPEVLKYQPDLIITASYGALIPDELVNLNTINIHASLLPKYRGASPIQASILSGDEATGITIMKMASKMDTGPIIYQKALNILPEDNFSTLLSRLAILGRDLLLEHLSDLIEGNYSLIPQDESLATYTKKITSNDQWISFLNPAKTIIQQIRSLNEVPGAFIKINNQSIKVFNAKISDIIFNSKGVVECLKKKFLISCADGCIEILELQIPSKRKMTAIEFLNGQKLIKIGDQVQ
ncbi:MAG: methionyl-tRNA formyltransferase [Acholeplasmatales bacterium]|jgi:methionyl-tRNA formyltransferase|nr:methionyl-tRNA formyltransferase [Acholeplasmatales bacterium]